MALILRQIRAGLPKRVLDEIENTPDFEKFNSGIDNTHVIESHPRYNDTEAEIVFPPADPGTRFPANYIICGRDRPRGVDSGYGGQGNSHSACIDIIAGLSGIHAREVDDNDEPVWTDKSPELDAARIYISQRTDVDYNFNLPKGSMGNSVAKSAVAVKADAVRLVARDGIKLITGTDAYDSQGVRIDIQHGIDLIAGNSSEDLQPLVKGKNLEEALQEIIDLVADLNGCVTGLLSMYFQLVTALVMHTHIALPLVGGPVSPSPDFAMGSLSQYSQITKLMFDLAIHQKNTVSTKADFTLPTGGGYINSVHNNTN